MKEKFEKILELASPYLKQGAKKDFVIHTQGVVKAMELLLEKEQGNEDILIPAAILHDVGWADVPVNLQKSDQREERLEGMKLHIECAPPIVEKVLLEAGYNESDIKRIMGIIVAHKFQENLIDAGKQLLVDADALSDAFSEQFYSDLKHYGNTPEEGYNYRKKSNQFYTKTGQEIFDKEMENRKKEFEVQ